MKLRILGLLVGVPWGVILNITIGARGVLSFVVGSAVCYAAYPLVCYLSKSNAPDNRPAVAGKVRRDVGFDFDAAITPHILRNWSRDRIVAFAKHLLGDECQDCPKPSAGVSISGDEPE
jgi:hypothetical protein